MHKRVLGRRAIEKSLKGRANITGSTEYSRKVDPAAPGYNEELVEYSPKIMDPKRCLWRRTQSQSSKGLGKRIQTSVG